MGDKNQTDCTLIGKTRFIWQKGTFLPELSYSSFGLKYTSKEWWTHSRAEEISLLVGKLPGKLINSVQFLSCVWLFTTPWTTAHQASLSVTDSQSLPKLMSIELVMPSNHLILCHRLLLLPSIFPNIRVFSNESALHQVAKVLEFQLQHQSFQWTPGTDFL